MSNIYIAFNINRWLWVERENIPWTIYVRKTLCSWWKGPFSLKTSAETPLMTDMSKRRAITVDVLCNLFSKRVGMCWNNYYGPPFPISLKEVSAYILPWIGRKRQFFFDTNLTPLNIVLNIAIYSWPVDGVHDYYWNLEVPCFPSWMPTK